MSKKIFRVFLVCLLVGALFFVFPPHFSSASATDTTFQVNVKEVLSVSITTPSANDWASGSVNQFLRNVISLDISSNNSQGFTAGMTTDSTSTVLTNSALNSATIPSITSNVNCTDSNCSALNANLWGYSINATAGSGLYKPLKPNTDAPDTVLSSATAASSHQDISFGAKADTSKASGTYTGTVVISVVSGTSGADLDGPATNADGPNANPNTPSYNSTTDQTTYTYTTNSGNTTTTQVSNGDNTDVYSGYTPPQGVTNVDSSNIYSGSLLTTILATTASVAAGSGIFFFILAKRKKDDDEEEEQTE